MKIKYLIILDYSCGELIKIRLSDEEQMLAEECEDFEDFLYSLEYKYDFRVKDCSWMCCQTLIERNF